jgi:hypothetical protein
MFNITLAGDDTKSKGQQKNKNVLQYLKSNHSRFQDDFPFLMCVCVCVCEQSIKCKGKSNFQAQHTRMGPNIINITWSGQVPAHYCVGWGTRCTCYDELGKAAKIMGKGYAISIIVSSWVAESMIKKKKEQKNHV